MTRKHLQEYKIEMEHEVINIDIYRDSEGYSHYDISIRNISKTTNIILQKIREEFISQISVGNIEFSSVEGAEAIRERFKEEIMILIKKYFPNVDRRTSDLLISELIRQNIGLGDLEILLKDEYLEEIVINSAKEPVWVYHKMHGWLISNIRLPSEARTRHYATIIGRDVGKDITVLKPLMDAHLLTGDRVNATLSPISSDGNTITIRKFNARPWTITDFIELKTISAEAAALIWLGVENELSILITGGTGSGKTSMLNVVSSFMPYDQRIISIEDTRELQLPNDLHWVPLETRMPNPEGKGEVTMLDLVINSLRMRPDRIIMGEVRRKREAEVLFEAMHTGHSVYATLHANNVQETIDRLTNPPIEVPKQVLSALSLIVVQNRNRRTGTRRTIQIAELMPRGEYSMLMQFYIQDVVLKWVNESKEIVKTINLYTGMSKEQIANDIKEKVTVINHITRNRIIDLHRIGTIFRKYFIHKHFKNLKKETA